MRAAPMALFVLLAGCKNQDLIDTTPEPPPDAPRAEPASDMGPDGCESPADCDDGDNCTDESCELGACAYQVVPCGCCIVQDTPGCGNESIETCVCALVDGDVCCDTAWDGTCIEDFSNFCAGNCDCCTAHDEGGCYDAVAHGAIADCVCAQDASCCVRKGAHGRGWDAQCVAEVVSLCGGTCP